MTLVFIFTFLAGSRTCQSVTKSSQLSTVLHCTVQPQRLVWVRTIPTAHRVSTATWYNMTADLQIKSCRVVVKKTDYSTRRVCERTPLIQLTTCTAPCIECHQLLLHPTGPGLYGSWSVPGGNTALLWSVSHNPESMGSCLLRIVRHVSAEGWWC